MLIFANMVQSFITQSASWTVPMPHNRWYWSWGIDSTHFRQHITSAGSLWGKPVDLHHKGTVMHKLFFRLKNGRIMPWQCPSVRLSVRPRFPDFSSTCFEISIWNLVYTFSRWHDMLSLSCITIGSLWPSWQPKVGQNHFLQSWPHKSK